MTNATASKEERGTDAHTLAKESGGLRVAQIVWEETRAILRPKFEAGDHWIIVAHILASPLITTIEQKYYLGDKNADFTLIIAFWHGQVYGSSLRRRGICAPFNSHRFSGK